MDRSSLLARVDAAFATTGWADRGWPDPHLPRPRDGAFRVPPRDEEYSRVTEPGKYGMVGARADAWVFVLVEYGAAAVEDVPVSPGQWSSDPPGVISRLLRVCPTAIDAQVMLIARSELDDIADAGVRIGFGEPTVLLDRIPFCGCDACDDGSGMLLDQLDQTVLSVLEGSVVRVTDGERVITAQGDSWSASGGFAPGEIESLVADARGRRSPYDVVLGAPWIDGLVGPAVR